MQTKGTDKRLGKKQVMMRSMEREVFDSSLPLSEAIQQVIMLKRAKNLKERTIADYLKNMRYFHEWIKGRYEDVSVNEISATMLREYVLWCANDKAYYSGHPFKEDFAAGRKGLTASSVNVRIRVIKTFFNELYEEGTIQQNPASNLSLLRQEIDTVEPLNDEELKKFLKAPNQEYFAQFRDYVIMILILDTGMRINEVCSLEKSELDFVQKRITLPAVKNKNRKSRILPLSMQCLRILRKLIMESEQHFESKHVFTTNYGEALNEKTIQKSFTNYAVKAKLQRNVSPHVLRHNFATMAANNGMSIFHLMKILGHSDIKTTRKYVQVSDSDMFEQHTMYSPLARVLKRS